MKKKAYLKAYYEKKKIIQVEPEKPEPVKTSWEKPVYSEPEPLTPEELADRVDGMTQKELNQSAKDIQDALEPIPGELPERYHRLSTEALSRIKLGESSLIFGLDSSNTREVDPETFTEKPVKIEDDSEVWVWPVREP